MGGDKTMAISDLAKQPITKEQLLQDALERKKKIRQDLIALSFEEKILRVIEMQKIERDLKKDKSKKIYVWSL